MSEQKQPKVRFSGFDDAWEQCTLKDVSARITRKNSNLESNLPLTISAQDGLVDQNTFFGKTIASKDTTGYFLLKKGEFAYNKSYSKGYPFGAVKRLDKYDEGVLSTLYIVFAPRHISSTFLAVYYDSKSWYKEIYRNAAEGARNHGLLNISSSDFFDSKLTIPSDKNEQRFIGRFIKTIDKLIAANQRQLEELKTIKKLAMQKIFDQEWRFNGFTDAWEQRKLDKVAEYRNGKGHEKSISSNGKYIVVNSKFVSTNGLVKKFTNIQMEPLVKGDIAFVLSDVPNGRALARTFLISKNNKYSLNQRIAGITPKNNISSFFLSSLMNRSPYFLKFDDGVSQTNLSKKDVENFAEMYPEFFEQKKISALLKSIDNLLAANQSKSEQLKKLKKWFMQNMFM
ncbi:restriction endonuclease subunit S [Pediococcus inopinatus]|uniref:restriction endonuclease subunit S n=2 Tax=Pediococcus inopinatus TaxID=114090 RepID=UPI001319C83F|nr:restriction endonuclease subunit S [Pediococcus inopinatus]